MHVEGIFCRPDVNMASKQGVSDCIGSYLTGRVAAADISMDYHLLSLLNWIM